MPSCSDPARCTHARTIAGRHRCLTRFSLLSAAFDRGASGNAESPTASWLSSIDAVSCDGAVHARGLSLTGPPSRSKRVQRLTVIARAIEEVG